MIDGWQPSIHGHHSGDLVYLVYWLDLFYTELSPMRCWLVLRSRGTPGGGVEGDREGEREGEKEIKTETEIERKMEKERQTEKQTERTRTRKL